MRKITCNKCGEKKDEIEFEYSYFEKKYAKVCKKCEDTHYKIFRGLIDHKKYNEIFKK